MSVAQVPAGPLPLLPLRRGVVLPGTTTTIPVGRSRSVQLAEGLRRGDLLFLAPQRDADVELPTLAELHRCATLARVQRVNRTDNGRYLVLVEGLRRVHLREITEREPFLKAEAGPVDEPVVDEPAVATLVDELRAELAAEASQGEPVRRVLEDALPARAGVFADRVANLVLGTDDELEVLLTPSVDARLRLVLDRVRRVRAQGDLKRRIEARVRKQREEMQREHLLREQMRAIQQELGEGDEELQRLRTRLADKELPDAVRAAADRELNRLEKVATASPAEAGVIRNWLEWVLDLPWSERAPEAIDLDAVQRKLDADHFGLQDAKKAILEHLAVLAVGGKAKGTILCLSGPPGVGKTSLGQSIADATGRPFVRIALGGVRDEAEIRGHRRTYVGSRPGRLLHGLKQAGVRNPVVLLDEIDKLGQGWMGSPEAALLEVLDPEQNHTFTDHYLEQPFDLSEVLFLCTVNELGQLAAPLRDRLEIVEVRGYTADEKVRIAKEHLLPTLLEGHAIAPDLLVLDDDALRAIVAGWTREAGVRQLQRSLRRLCRQVALRVARTADRRPDPLVVREDDLHELLGRRRFYDEVAERTAQAGVATGLAWTPVGGDVLFVETIRMPGKGQLQITGQLGDVMKESARAALSYVRSRAVELGIDPHGFDEIDLHIHVPAGAVPKDGPSAGVTMFTALTSLMTGRRVRPDVAMTGECTLRGRVLPVGGIKEKVIAAHRAGLSRVVLPKRNEADLTELPDDVRAELEFVFVQDMDEVLEAALEPDALPGRSHGAAAHDEEGVA